MNSFKLIVITPLGERILRTSMFKECEVVVEGMVLKANFIPLEMSYFDVILVWIGCQIIGLQ